MRSTAHKAVPASQNACNVVRSRLGPIRANDYALRNSNEQGGPRGGGVKPHFLNTGVVCNTDTNNSAPKARKRKGKSVDASATRSVWCKQSQQCEGAVSLPFLDSGSEYPS